MTTKADCQRLRNVRVFLNLEPLERRELFACGLPPKLLELTAVPGFVPYRLAQRSEADFIVSGSSLVYGPATVNGWMVTVDADLGGSSPTVLPSLGGKKGIPTWAHGLSQNGEWITGWSKRVPYGPTEAFRLNTWDLQITALGFYGLPPYESIGYAIANSPFI
jgi:hypothetical protein